MMYLDDGPMGALPKPDFILSYPYLCDPHAKWWEVEAHYFDVPVISIDGPFLFSNKIEEYQVKWLVEEFKKVFAAIEQITGHKFDYDRFKEVMNLSSQAREAFWEVLKLRQTIPCPRGLREVVGDLFYIVTQMGTQEAVDYFTMLRDDVKERAENKIGIVPEERFRLIWDNIPLWYRLQLIDYFAEKGAVFVMDSYPTTNWVGFHFDGGHFDPEKPFESLAWNELHKNAWLSLDLQMKRFERMVREWHCDGVVFHSNRGCQILSRAVPEKERLVRERTGVLTMSFEAEMADPRSLHEAEVKARIDSFLEMLEERKSKTKGG
jgi:benzoyl-CoA reductase/2-hydroxyglutaryl-CoA dehydratase subunit BcrC/BadD/HgdB